MQNLIIKPTQNNITFSGSKNAGRRTLSIFTEPEVKTQEDKKRNSIIKKALGIAGGIGLAALLLSPKFIPKSAKEKIMQKIKGMENGKLKDITTKGLEYTKNIGINFTGVKDNFCSWIKDKKIIGAPYRWLDKGASALYTKTGVKTAKKIGTKPQKAFDFLTKNIDDIKSKLDAEKLAKEIEINGDKKPLSAWLDDIATFSKENAGDFAKNFNADEVDKIAQNLDKTFDGISPKYRENVMSRIKEGNWKDLFKVSIYDDMYQKEYAEHSEKIADLVNKSTKNNKEIKKIIEGLKNSGELSKKDICYKMQYAAKNAEKSTKKCKEFFGADLFEKLREIKGGNAATDVIFTGGVPLGAYLFANSKAKTKEDKTSLALTTGIPLALGVGGTIYSTCKVIAGWKALLVGGAITIISSIAGKTADTIYRKKHHLEESTLPTLNIPKEIENSGLAKTIETGVETVLDAQI